MRGGNAWQAIAFAGALCSLGIGAHPAAPGPYVVTEPALFVGMVEVTGDTERGFGVLLSTATEEVIVADGAVARRLAHHAGEVVAAEGRLLEQANRPATMVVREFRVLGTPPRDHPTSASVRRAGGG